MVSLEYAAKAGRAIPENWYAEVLNMTEQQFSMFAARWPVGSMVLPKAEKPKKAAPKKKA